MSSKKKRKQNKTHGWQVKDRGGKAHNIERKAIKHDTSYPTINVDNNVPLTITSLHLSTTFNQEKKHERGEDADPLSIIQENVGFLGVFDGMGGSGATEYTLPNGDKHTGAYLASRLVCQSVYNYLEQKPQHSIDVTDLKRYIKEHLDKYIVEHNIKPTRLHSSIIRILPTTLSVIAYKQDNDKIDIYSYWCGDSRNYLLTKDGLRQISIDDLKSRQDPLENLRNDDALSNCISQDRDFTINNMHIENQKIPIILFSATDGCFGYIPTPMHFENLLLETLIQANDIEQWKNNIIETLKPISGDDFSMSIVMLGLTFEEWKTCLQPRLKEVQMGYIQPLEEIEKEVNLLQIKVEETKQLLYDTTTDLWNSYKTNYLTQQ